MRFLNGLDSDIKKSLIAQLRNLWTHTSTALEGNTLTLGETAFVIEEGLTISGKPLKDHQEVIGHARAIELIYGIVAKDQEITESDLFDLHKAVITEIITDIYQKPGEWKQESNGTYTVDENDNQVYIEYATVRDTPVLMKQFIDKLNHYRTQATQDPQKPDNAVKAFVDLHIAFVRIHPFYDGNGRMARLLANIPLLVSGHPPLLIPNEHRLEYIRSLAKYELAVGQIKPGDDLFPDHLSLESFTKLCMKSWTKSLGLVAKAHEQQARRSKDIGC